MGRAKGGLISESLSSWLQPPKKCAQNYLELYPPQSLWHIFWEICTKVENFLRLSHLYDVIDKLKKLFPPSFP
jgi:hypothetical protein